MESDVHLRFPEVEPLSGCGLRLDEVYFAYDTAKPIFKNIDISSNADSRVVIVSFAEFVFCPSCCYKTDSV